MLGLISFAVGATAPAAWYLGAKAEKQITANGQYHANTQNIRIGKIIGMVMTIVLLVGMAFALVWMIFVFSMMADMFASFPR